MIPVLLSWVAEQVNGQLIAQQAPDLVIEGVSTDTRSLLVADLYLALKGPNFDGHQFVKQAEQKGAIALILSRKVDTHLPYILVKNTTLAFCGSAIQNV